MTALAALASWAAVVLAVAVLSRSRAGARVGVGIAAAQLAVPVLAEGLRIARFALATLAVLCLFRALDLARGRAPASLGARAAHLVSLFDTRRSVRRSPGVDRAAGVKLVLATAAFAAAFEVVRIAVFLRGPVHYALLWIATAVMAFAGFEILSSAVVGVAALCGVAAPTIHDHPYRARSLAEFWGRRWNRAVSAMLHAHCFAPLARRGAAAGLLASFAASAAIHAYAGGVAVGGAAALSWAAFFLAQPALILLERRLRVHRWRPAAGRAWTLGVLAALSPLFLEPFIRLFLSRPHP